MTVCAWSRGVAASRAAEMMRSFQRSAAAFSGDLRRPERDDFLAGHCQRTLREDAERILRQVGVGGIPLGAPVFRNHFQRRAVRRPVNAHRVQPAGPQVCHIIPDGPGDFLRDAVPRLGAAFPGRAAHQQDGGTGRGFVANVPGRLGLGFHRLGAGNVEAGLNQDDGHRVPGGVGFVSEHYRHYAGLHCEVAAAVMTEQSLFAGN